MGGTVADTKLAMQELTGRQFEHFVADLWERRGYETRVTQGTSDRGIDVIATHQETGRRELIQAKCYKETNKVGVRPVREFLGTTVSGDERVFVTTSSYTTDAKAEAFDTDRTIRFYDGNKLADLVRETEGEQLLQAYLEAGDTIPEHQRHDADRSGRDRTDSDTGQTARVNRVLLAVLSGAAIVWFGLSANMSVGMENTVVAGGVMLAWLYPPYTIYGDLRSLGNSPFESLIWPILCLLLLPVILPMYYVYLRKWK